MWCAYTIFEFNTAFHRNVSCVSNFNLDFSMIFGQTGSEIGFWLTYLAEVL